MYSDRGDDNGDPILRPVDLLPQTPAARSQLQFTLPTAQNEDNLAREVKFVTYYLFLNLCSLIERSIVLIKHGINLLLYFFDLIRKV
mgnify:CR=1 FL=1